MKFDTEQKRYIECNTKNNVVFGPPGSGKSTTLKGRIKHLLSAGCKVESQLVMTFYVTTKENLTSLLEDVFGSSTKYQVRTVHSICYRLLDVKDVSTSIVRALRVPSVRFSAHFSNISHIYIDEGQLLDVTAIDFVKKIRFCCPWISVDLIGDPAQNCRTEVDCEEDEFMVQYTGARYELVNNYRSCSDIVRFCNLTHPFNQMKPMIATKNEKGDVKLFVGTRGEQLQGFVRMLTSLPANETKCILCSCRHPHIGMSTHLCCQDLANHLNDIGVSFTIWYDENKSRSEFSSARRPDAPVVISTIQGSLGREFDHVFQFSYHHRLNKKIPTKKQHYHNTKLCNIARSRAKVSFTMFCGSEMEMFMTRQDALEIVSLASSTRPKTIKNVHKRGVFADDDSESEDAAVVKLGSLNSIPPERLMRMQDIFGIHVVEKSNMWSNRFVVLPNYDEMCTLYGKFAESMVCLFSTQTFPDRDALLEFTQGGTIVVKDGDREEAQYVLKELNLIERRMGIMRHHLNRLYDKVVRLQKSNTTRKRNKFARFYSNVKGILESILSQASDGKVSLHFENKNIWCDIPELLLLAKSEQTPTTVFNICLFWWQYENQSAWRMFQDYSPHISSLSWHIDEWKKIGTSYSFECQFPVILTNDKFGGKKIMGAADCVLLDPPTIFEWKFSPGGFSNVNRLQLALYSHALEQNTNITYKAVLGNLYTGEMETIEYNFAPSDDIFEVFFGETLALDDSLRDTTVVNNPTPTYDCVRTFSIVQF